MYCLFIIYQVSSVSLQSKNSSGTAAMLPSCLETYWLYKSRLSCPETMHANQFLRIRQPEHMSIRATTGFINTC